MDAWVERTALRFWEQSGEPDAFPRNMEVAVSMALPITIAKLPKLGALSAEQWFANRGTRVCWGQRDRPLRAVLFATDGDGFILLDGTDSPEEQRYSLAHETAHFLVEYQQPRARVVAALGRDVVDVLDGRRRATHAEAIDGVLAGVDVGPHLHAMARGVDGIDAGEIAESEQRADALALELLAPRDLATDLLCALGTSRDLVAAAEQCSMAFGLPRDISMRYVRKLRAELDPTPSYTDWFA